MALDIVEVRSHFPALSSGYIFAGNAGGSQILKSAVDRISDYLLNTNVQLGADYSISVQSTQRVDDGAVDAAKIFNATSVDEVAFGSSSTMLIDCLARASKSDICTGDEFVITGEHECNVGPWKKLADRRGAIIKYWKATPSSPDNPFSISLKIEDLLPLISSKTRFVAFTACSNILGHVVPVRDIIKAVRAQAKEKGAPKVETSVDCVAYAPHRRIDVQDWDVDYCVFSLHKLYGPHNAVIYTRQSCQSSLTSHAHHFLKVDHLPYKLRPGGPGFELVYGSTAVLPYLLSLTPLNDLDASYNAIAAHEQTLINPLLSFLTDEVQRDRGVRVVGPETGGLSRVPTICFVVVGQNPIRSQDVVKVFHQKSGIGIRYGHFYAYTLVDDIRPKLDIRDGVVRISLVHYNTVKEVETIIDILKEILA